jgi:hypothetical protein
MSGMPRLGALRAFSWLALFDAARTTLAHLDDRLDARDRRRVAAIVKRTKGDPRALTAKEKSELRLIARQLELGRLARDLLPHAGRLRRARR